MACTDEFWDAFVEHHHASVPGAWRRVFARPLVEMADVFDWLLLAARRCEQGDDGLRYRLFSSGRPLADPLKHLPHPSDLSVAGYLGRLDGELGQVGLLVNELQAVHPTLWLKLVDFLRGLYARVGMPAGGALLDLFSGSYETGFFGVHKDDQDVFTMVLEGKKRFLVWPFEALADRIDAQGVSPQCSWALDDLDIDDVRSSAMVLEGEPGDLLYWPASHWHVAEAAEKGAPVTTFSLGLFRHPDPMQSIALAMQDLADEELATLPECLPHPSAKGCDLGVALDRARDATRRPLLSPAFAELHDARLLERLTAFGFRLAPNPLPPEPLELDQVMCATSEQPVSWVRTDEDILWSAHGYAFRFPPHRGIERLFTRICEGRAESVADWIRVARGGASSAGLPDESVLHVIGMLMRHHAIARVDR